MECRNTHRICAERKLIDKALEDARRHGVSSHNIVSWLHRKNKGQITVARLRGDGSWGCSIPCVECRKVLLRFHIRVQCFTHENEWFSGYLDQNDAPVSKMTSGQKKKRNKRNKRNKMT